MKISAIKRNPWPWAIIAYFAVFASAMATWVVYAAHQKVDLVANDYYEQEIRYQEQIDRLGRTRAIRGLYSVAYDPIQQVITIRLPENHAHGGAVGEVHLYRPSDARLDRSLRLALDAEGRQSVPAAGLSAGLWKIRATWDFEGKGYGFEEPVVVSNPKL